MSNLFKRLYVYRAIVDNWMSKGVVLMFIFLAKLDEKDRRDKLELIYQNYRVSMFNIAYAVLRIRVLPKMQSIKLLSKS